MSHNVTSTGCPVVYKPVDPVPFYQDGQLNFKAHQVGWIISGFFALVATSCTVYLVDRHLVFYTCPQQQRHIVRMLLMVPIYAIVSWLSYFYYNHAIYYETVRDCYESVVITSFFYLLLQYIGDTPVEQDEVFRNVKLKKWFFPLGWWKYRPSGLHFLWLMKISILQYAIVRPVCTLAAVALEYFGYYCLASWSPKFGHIYISLIISISVTVAMYCVVQFYLPVQKELKPYSPVLKFLSVKTIVFLVFWQSTFLSILAYFNVIKETEYMTVEEVQVGINALLETFEMFIFGFVHLVAFTHKIYRPADRTRRTKRWAAFKDVIDFRDWWYGMKDSSRYVLARSRGRDFTYVDEVRRQKYDHLEKAMGRDRWAELDRERQRAKAASKSFFKDGGGPDEGSGDVDVEDTAASSVPDSEKKAAEQDSRSKMRRGLSSAAASGENDPSLGRPKGNRALDPLYDPEAEDTGNLDDNEEDDAFDGDQDDSIRRESRGLMSHIAKPALPTLPSLHYDDTPPPLFAPERKTFRPDQRRYKLTALDDIEQEEELDEKVQDAKEARSRRQGSGSIGAWWRGVVARLSGSETAEPVHPQADEVLGSVRSSDHDDRPAVSKKWSSSSNESAEISALRDADSPLDRFIATHQSPEGTSEHSPVNATRELVGPATPRQTTAETRPPILQTVSTGRIDKEALGMPNAFSRVSSMRTTAARTEATHADSHMSPRLLPDAVGRADSLPVLENGVGVQSHAASVDGHAANGAAASSPVPAPVSSETSPSTFQPRDYTARDRPPSPTASSAAGVPRGTLFSDPATDRYAARAATRPPVQISSGGTSKSTRLPVSRTSGLTRESKSMIRAHRSSEPEKPVELASQARGLRTDQSRHQPSQAGLQTPRAHLQPQQTVQSPSASLDAVLRPQDFSSQRLKHGHASAPNAGPQVQPAPSETPVVAPRPVRASAQQLSAPSTSTVPAQKRISTGSSTSFIAPPNSIFSSSPIQTEAVLGDNRAISASGSKVDSSTVAYQSERGVILASSSTSGHAFASLPADSRHFASTSPQIVAGRSMGVVESDGSQNAGLSEPSHSARTAEIHSPRARSSQPPPLAAPHRAPSVSSAKTTQSGPSAGVASPQTATGPKGKKISLILPTALSPKGLSEPANVQEPVSSQRAAPASTTTSASGRERRLTSQDIARPDARSSTSGAPRSRSDSVPKHKSMEEKEREYLGLPAKPGTKGTVTNGALSQAQRQRAEEQAAVARADAERVEAFEMWRAEKERFERAARNAENAARAKAQAERIKSQSPVTRGPENLTAAPKVGPSQIAAIQPASVSKRTWFGTKTKQPAPYTPLPAPSQLGVDVGEDADAFTAAATAAKSPIIAAEARKEKESNRAGIGASQPAAGPAQDSRDLASGLQPGQTINPYAYQRPRPPAPRQVVPQPYPNVPGMPGSRFMTGGPQTFRAQHSSDQAMRHMEEEQWRRQQMQETILAQRRARRHSIESAEYEQRGQTMQQRPSYVRDGYGSSRERRHSIDPAEQSRTYHLPGPPPFQGPAPSSASRPYRSHVSHFNQPYIVEPARSRRDTMQGGARAYQGPPQMQGSRQYSLPTPSRGMASADPAARTMHPYDTRPGSSPIHQQTYGRGAPIQGQSRRASRGYELPEGFSVDYVD